MLHTQFYDASGTFGSYGYGYGYGGLGALQSSAAITSLQNYLKSIGKYSTTVTGVMNDATMGAIFDLFIASAGTVAKIPLLPADVRDGINKVVSAMKTADDKIKSISFGQASLSTVIRNWININAAVRLISSSAADAMANAREAVYNAVGGQASTIEKALRIFFPPAQPAPATATSAAKVGILQTGLLTTQIKTAVPGAATGPTPGGTIFAFSKKLGKFRIAVPRTAGLGGIGVMEDGVLGSCIFGDCGLGATPAAFTEVAPNTAAPAGGRQVTETELEKQTGTLPFYKKPLFWAAVGGGVVVVGGGSYFLLRRRKAPAAAAKAA